MSESITKGMFTPMPRSPLSVQRAQNLNLFSAFNRQESNQNKNQAPLIKPILVSDHFSQSPSGSSQTILGNAFSQILSPKEMLQQEKSKPSSDSSGYAPSDQAQMSQSRRANLKSAQSMSQPFENINSMLKKSQEMVQALTGDPTISEDLVREIGPNATFEEVLAYIMMKIARDEEKKVMERIQILENGGHPGLKGWLSQKAGDLGGVVGGAMAAAAGGGLAGAAVGQDVGKRLVNGFTGYSSEDSRQIQFEKLKQQMNKLNEMMSCISNILQNMHQTTKNTISNMGRA